MPFSIVILATDLLPNPSFMSKTVQKHQGSCDQIIQDQKVRAAQKNTMASV